MSVNRRATTQDISWFLDLYRNEQLDLNPSYQRRSVWSPKDRRFFLDTIFRGYPSPQIFLHKMIVDGKTQYAVVDGKQRLETIIMFVENKIAIDKTYGDTRLNGKKWKHIKDNPELTRLFWDYVVPVEFINVIEGTNYVNDVFDRLNRSSRKLVEQELRNAKFEGWFITFVERESEEADWKELGIVTTARSKRMSDVQFLSELLIVLLKNDISGFDQNEISQFYADYEEPNEMDFDFDEYSIKAKFSEARTFLIELEKENSAVSGYGKHFKDFYSLWSLIILNKEDLATVKIFASGYSEFMHNVNRFKEDSFLTEENIKQFNEHHKYFQNSLGANTEAPQRRERYNALKSILIDRK
ncbi:MAG: DUF262 domain-containing protein [bacterium]|nr:DUF262 domain-containing protein [bacterium]